MEAHSAQRLLIALACVLSVISILTPFLHAEVSQVEHPEPVILSEDFWSLRYTIKGFFGMGDTLNEERWLADFWSRPAHTFVFKQPFIEWVGRVFVIMFLTQILTVLFGLLSIIKPKPILLLLSTILSTATIFSMSFITQALLDYYVKTIQTGYFLTVASTALFLTVFIWKIRSRQQPT